METAVYLLSEENLFMESKCQDDVPQLSLLAVFSAADFYLPIPCFLSLNLANSIMSKSI